MLIGTVPIYFYQGFVQHKWWPLNFVLSLAMPFTIVPIAVWYIFVPGHLAFDDLALLIQPRFRRVRTFPWGEMIHWRTGNKMLFIRFDGSQMIQIFLSAYPPEQWSQLTEFLSAEFPDRKADGHVGIWSFRLRR